MKRHLHRCRQRGTGRSIVAKQQRRSRSGWRWRWGEVRLGGAHRRAMHQRANRALRRRPNHRSDSNPPCRGWLPSRPVAYHPWPNRGRCRESSGQQGPRRSRGPGERLGGIRLPFQRRSHSDDTLLPRGTEAFATETTAIRRLNPIGEEFFQRLVQAPCARINRCHSNRCSTVTAM